MLAGWTRWLVDLRACARWRLNLYVVIRIHRVSEARDGTSSTGSRSPPPECCDTHELYCRLMMSNCQTQEGIQCVFIDTSISVRST